MTNSQQPESERPIRRRRRRWVGVGLTIGSVLVLAGAGTAWWGWVFINQRFSPWASAELSKSLKRPVNVGEIERLTFSGVRIGPSKIAAIPTDPDTLSMAAVEVRFGLLGLLRRELNLTIVLEQVDGYLEQDADLQWLDIDFEALQPEREREPIIQVKANRIELKDSKLTLVPYSDPGLPRQKVGLENIQADVDLINPELETARGSGQPEVQAQQIDFEAKADSVVQGSLAIAGSVLLPPAPEEAGEATGALPPAVPGAVAALLDLLDRAEQLTQRWVLPPVFAQTSPPGDDPLVDRRINLNVRAQAAQATEIAAIVFSVFEEKPPISITGGSVSGNVDIAVLPEEPLSVQGTARFSDGVVAVKALPTPVDNINGLARFKGQQVALESVTGSLGELSATAAGTIDFNQGYDLTGKINPFTAAQFKELFKLSPPVPVEGTFAATVEVVGPLARPNLSVSLVSQGVTSLDKVEFASVGANLSVDPDALVIESFRVVPLAGGELTGSGLYTLSDPATLTLTAEGRDLPADALGRPYGLPERVMLGPVFLEVGLSGPINQLQGAVSWRAPAGDYPARGDIEIAGNTLRFRDTFVQVAGGTVSGNGTLARGNWDAVLQARGIQLARFSPQANGVASGNLQLAGNLRTPGINSIRGRGNATVAIAGGTINGNAAIAGGGWNSTIQAQGLQLSQFFPTANGAASGNFQLAGRLDNLTPNGISGQGNATVALASGVVTGQGRVRNGAWNANIQSQGIQLSQFSEDLQGTAGGQFDLSGQLDNLTLAGIRGQGSFVVADGLAAIAPRYPELAAVQEPLTGVLAWNGSRIQVQQASTAGLFASGTITPQLGGPNGPRIASLDLDLQAREFNLAALPLPNQVPISGRATFDGRLSGSPANLSLVGDARLANLALSDLAFEPVLAGPVRYTSGGDIAVNLTGRRDQIVVNYGLSDRNLAFDIRAGQSLAAGSITNDILQARIVEFPLQVLNLTPSGEEFGVLRGTVETANISGDVSRPSLFGTFAIREPGFGYIDLSRFEGQLAYADRTVVLTSGRLAADGGEYLVTGRFSQRGEPQLVASVEARNAQVQNVLTTLQLFEFEDFQRGLQRPEWFRRYTPEQLAAALPLSPAGDADASLWEQLKRLSELLELADQVAAARQNEPLPPLRDLQGRFNGTLEIAGSLPDLTVDFDLDGQDWLWARQNPPSQPPAKGPRYQVDQVTVEGRYGSGVLRLNSLQLASNLETAQPSSLTLAGEVGLDRSDPTPRTLTAKMINVPLESLRQPLRLPDSIDGQINADASLTGSLANPQVRGVASLDQATINDEQLQSAQASFLYQDARLNLNSEVIVNNPETPLTLTASVPYRMPFATQMPLSSALTVDVNVEDDGIALLNLFTQAVTWESGRGTIDLVVRGNWEDGQVPDIQRLAGFANFEQAVVKAQVLPEPLTDVQGQVRFESDRIIVDQLAGQFSQGEVRARGTLPLINPIISNFPPVASAEAAAAATASQIQTAAEIAATPQILPVEPETVADVANLPLTIDAENINLDFKGIYKGQVNGRVQIGGSLLLYGPLLTGPVVLSQGRLSLPDSSADSGTVVNVNTGSENQSGGFQLPPPALDNLELRLAENVRVAVGGVVDVAAQGTVVANGIYPAIRPEGIIRLPSGRINLVTTEFRLTGDQNYAEFRPNLGLEPYIRATLRAAVPASAGGSTTLVQAAPFPRNEIPDANRARLGLNQGGIETVRIEAQVEGPASQIAQLRGVTLTSTPTRSEQEIISLISGGFLTALESTLGSVGGSGDSFQGLIALAGTAVLNRIQDLLGSTLSVTELRLFSATPPSGQGTGTALDFGGEIGFALTPTISLSVQKVFTNVTPAQFNLRYRINDQFLLRGTTSYENFRENSGVLLEYESRF